MNAQLEHANLCVSDIDGMIKFLKTALPDFKIRHDETDNDGDRWVHIGNDKTYIALNNSMQKDSSGWAPYWDPDCRGALYGLTRNTGAA